MKLQNKQEIALFKGEGESDNTELDSSSSLSQSRPVSTFSFQPHDFWPAEILEQPPHLKLDFDLFFLKMRNPGERSRELVTKWNVTQCGVAHPLKSELVLSLEGQRSF